MFATVDFSFSALQQTFTASAESPFSTTSSFVVNQLVSINTNTAYMVSIDDTLSAGMKNPGNLMSVVFPNLFASVDPIFTLGPAVDPSLFTIELSPGIGNSPGVPGPVVGTGLPGLILACGVLLALARRRRQIA